ncbi:MAG: peptide ABC transporter substrate-binding protein, partial [Sedimentisphaerales bacterium]|nr:peptide ABC transporter substrate-binding protein [Sedimentisphaerales bacterium]
MKRVLTVLLIVLGILLIGLLACYQSPPPRAYLVYALGDSIETLDPAQMSWHDENQLAIALWEGLVSYHPQTLEPVEAVAYLPPQISADRRVYTFGLRPEARWSNGDPVTAADFVRGWRRAIEPGTAKDYKFFLLDNIEGAKDYYQWRSRAVRLLTILRDLQQDKAIPPADWQWLDDQLDPDGRTDDSWSDLADRIRQEHLEQMDQHFARVGIEVVDPHRLRVTLTRPVSYMLSLFAWVTFMPAHRSVELLREDDPALSDLTLCSYDSQWTKPDYHHKGYPGLITNGPFYLADWQFKRHLLLKKNPHYWDRDRVPAESIMARIILEKNTAWLSYERGEVDWLDYVSNLDFAPTLVEQARRHRRDDIHVCPSFATYFYNFNCRSRRPDGSPNPFSDWRVRMAFSLAVDKEAIIKNVRKIDTPVAHHIIPPDSIAGYSSPPAPSYDPARARRLLAEAGYPGGQGLGTVEILY